MFVDLANFWDLNLVLESFLRISIFPTTLCLWVFFSTSLQEHTDTKVGNCVFKRPSGGGTQVVVVIIVVGCTPPFTF